MVYLLSGAFFCDSVRIFPNLYTLRKLLIKYIIRKLLQKAVFWYQNKLQGMKDNNVMHVNIKYVLMYNTGLRQATNFFGFVAQDTFELYMLQFGRCNFLSDPCVFGCIF